MPKTVGPGQGDTRNTVRGLGWAPFASYSRRRSVETASGWDGRANRVAPDAEFQWSARQDHHQRVVSKSAATSPRNDTCQYVAAAQRHTTALTGRRVHDQSVFTPKSTPDAISTAQWLRRTSGMLPSPVASRRWIQGARISRHVRRGRCSGSDAGVVQPPGVSTWTPASGLLATRLSTRRHTRFPPCQLGQRWRGGAVDLLFAAGNHRLCDRAEIVEHVRYLLLLSALGD